MTQLFDYWRSSASYRVRIALNLLGISYDSIPVDLVKGEQRSAENTARNPQGLVPTLMIDDLSLTQSLAILEYLDETRGGLMPKDAAGRARVRALAYVIAMEVAPVCNLSVRNHVASFGVITADAWVVHYVTKGLAAFEAMLGDIGSAGYCHADQISIADLCLVPQVYNAERVGIDIAAYPRINQIMVHLNGIPAVAAAHPDRVKP